MVSLGTLRFPYEAFQAKPPLPALLSSLSLVPTTALCVCVCVCLCVQAYDHEWHRTCVEVRGHLVEVNPLLPSHGSQGLIKLRYLSWVENIFTL
jgi:hypothetical protein